VRACLRPKSATSEASANQEAGSSCRYPFTLVSEYTTVTKLFVGNLPFTATEASVRTLFSAHGTVETVALITDRDTGRPRGFGFVEVSSADAARAIQALNGMDFEGRALKVNEAQERERSGGDRHGGARR
jgi:RNA recognition motif-containing protein